MKEKILFILISLILWAFTSNVYAEKGDLQFLFSEDQNIKSLKGTEDLIEKLKVDDDVKNNEWFNSPPTRIELLTIVLNQHHKEQMKRYDWDYFFSEKFEKRRKEVGDDDGSSTIVFWVNYIPKFGSFMVHLNARYLGKPKEPMKGIIKELVSLIEFYGNYGGQGFSYQNSFLQHFEIFPNTDKETIVNVLKGNIIIGIDLRCKYDDKQYNMRDKGYQPIRKTYQLSGWTKAYGKDIYYIKRANEF